MKSRLTLRGHSRLRHHALGVGVMYSNNLALRDTWSTRGAGRYHLALHGGWGHRNRSRGTSRHTYCLGGGNRAPSIPKFIPSLRKFITSLRRAATNPGYDAEDARKGSGRGRRGRGTARFVRFMVMVVQAHTHELP